MFKVRNDMAEIIIPGTPLQIENRWNTEGKLLFNFALNSKSIEYLVFTSQLIDKITHYSDLHLYIQILHKKFYKQCDFPGFRSIFFPQKVNKNADPDPHHC